MLRGSDSRFCRSAVFLSLSFSPCEALYQTFDIFHARIILPKHAAQGPAPIENRLDSLDAAIFHEVANNTAQRN
jgi:hypothetical protein